jgi:hypothetical protein
MTDLSIAARAVLDASNLLPGKDSYLILAAALRAAADQVVPESCFDSDDAIRSELLEIAAELEAFGEVS